MATPIIVPVNTTTIVTRNCIYQDNVRYCESRPINGNEVGLFCLVVAIFLMWAGFWTWVAMEKDKFHLGMFFIFVFPFIVGAIIGLIK